MNDFEKNQKKIQNEYERVKILFSEVDEKLSGLLDGTIREFARIKIELDNLSEIAKESGLVKIHSENPTIQKELPIAKVIVKVRANYINYAAKLSSILGKEISAIDEDFGLDEFE